MTESKARASFERRWDIRTGSPRKLWRALDDFLTDNGYYREYHELVPKDSPIEGTAVFSDTFHGRRDVERTPRLWLWIIGLLLCFTILFIPLGLKLMKASFRTLRTRITIRVEGEAYRARGADVATSRAAEVLDVVADARITLKADSGRADDKDPYAIVEKTKDEREIEKLKIHFDDLEKRLGELLPTIALPEIKGPTAKI